MKPIEKMAHERAESPSMEKREHKLGRELMPKAKRVAVVRKGGSDRKGGR